MSSKNFLGSKRPVQVLVEEEEMARGRRLRLAPERFALYAPERAVEVGSSAMKVVGSSKPLRRAGIKLAARDTPEHKHQYRLQVLRWHELGCPPSRQLFINNTSNRLTMYSSAEDWLVMDGLVLPREYLVRETPDLASLNFPIKNHEKDYAEIVQLNEAVVSPTHHNRK